MAMMTLYARQGKRHRGSEEHTSELQSPTHIAYAVFCFIYMEFRKMAMMTLYARQGKRHRCV